MANDPGWYPDPWRPGRRRWWDGGAWTDHTYDPDAPAAPAPPAWPAAPDAPSGPAWQPVTPWQPVDPAALAGRDLRAEERIAGWAKRAMVALLVGTVLGHALNIATFGDTVDALRNIDTANPGDSPGLDALTQLLAMLNLGCIVLLMVWTSRAATLARNLHYPAARSVGWGVAGWLVPIVNFWFPYQAVRDMLPPGHPARAVVGRWWGCYLVAAFGGLLLLVVSLVSIPVAFALLVPVAIAAALAAKDGSAIVDAVRADHAAMVQRIVDAR